MQEAKSELLTVDEKNQEEAVVLGKDYEAIKKALIVPAEEAPLPLVRPVVSPAEAAQAWREYRELEQAILEEEDFLYQLNWTGSDGKLQSAIYSTRSAAERMQDKIAGSYIERRKKKSAFRKMGRFFGLRLPSRDPEAIKVELQQFGEGEYTRYVEIEYGNGYVGKRYLDQNMDIIRAEYAVTVVAGTPPRTLSMTGIAACSRAERGFTHAGGHDIVATGFTRALNRAISDLVGWGEVSAEEIAIGLVEEEIKGIEKAEVVSVKPAVSAPPVPKEPAKEAPGEEPADQEELIPNLPKFISKCLGAGIPVVEATTLLGIKDFGEVTDFSAAWRTLQQRRKE